MAAPGRKPKAPRLELLQGTPGKRSVEKSTPKPPPKVPGRPKWLAAEAKREWSRIVPVLERLGLLSEVDRAVLTAYCEAWACYVEAQENVKQYGSILSAKGSDYIQVSPWVTIRRQEREVMRQLCAELGLTPSSRGRMSISDKNNADEFDRYMSGEED